MQPILFELKALHYSYTGFSPALCDINLSVHAGEKLTLLGANGTGKSTLLTLLDGLVFSQTGTCKAFGRELNEAAFQDRDFSRLFRQKVGLVFQNPEVQLFCPTIREDILFGPLQLGISRTEAKCRLEKLTHLLNIQDLLDRSPHQLSIGEKRKVAIATTLAVEPDVILLDEPTAGLDPATTQQIVNILLEANQQGKTLVTATHDLHLVEEISDRVCVFDRSRSLARIGSPADILSDTLFLQNHNLMHSHRHAHEGFAHSHPHHHPVHPVESNPPLPGSRPITKTKTFPSVN